LGYRWNAADDEKAALRQYRLHVIRGTVTSAINYTAQRATIRYHDIY
jgi:hypothetical protein